MRQASSNFKLTLSYSSTCTSLNYSPLITINIWGKYSNIICSTSLYKITLIYVSTSAPYHLSSSLPPQILTLSYLYSNSMKLNLYFYLILNIPWKIMRESSIKSGILWLICIIYPNGCIHLTENELKSSLGYSEVNPSNKYNKANKSYSKI